MSTVSVGLGGRDRSESVLRGGALIAALLVMASYLSAMYHVVDVVGDPTELIVVVVASLAAATALSRYLTVRRATVLSTAMLAVGLLWYLLSLPGQSFAFVPHFEYIVALLTGHSILEIINLENWVLAVTPAPVFLTWYLALQRYYGATAVIGAATVGFFVLTGDATFPVAMVGSVGTLALIGLGKLERAGASLGDAEIVSLVLAAIVVVSLVFSVVPAGAMLYYSPDTGFIPASEAGGGNTIEANLLTDSQSLQVKGSIELSPKVRWTVESDAEAYWRVGTYDLYTGEGWARRSGGASDPSTLDGPPGESRRVVQTYTAETRIGTMPSAWRPVSVEGPAADAALATDLNSLRPSRALQAGESYTVISQVPIASSNRLQNAGTDYPQELFERYTQLPDSTPDRVERRTERLTANANTPYEVALTVEQWLRDNREYSLDVPQPGNNVADEFLFERQRGYCVYYATTMAVMLRTQGIPARMTVGYTTGEQVGEDTWVVRGYNSHAWVEAYFPDVGWIRFDPTPDGPREAVESQTLQDARSEGSDDVDTNETRNAQFTTTTTTTPVETPDWLNETTTDTATNRTIVGPNELVPGPDSFDPNATNLTRTVTDQQSGGDGGDDEFGGGMGPPSREEAILGVVALLGVIAGVRRSGASSRIYQEIWLRWQPRQDPETDVERAYERVVHVLEETHRGREPGETPRQYLEAIGASDRAKEVARIRERARYGGSITEADADHAVELADELVGER